VLLGGCLSEYIVGAAVSEDCPGIDLSSDPDNCSACGVPCPEGEACVDGRCDSSCPGDDEVCQRLCVDLDASSLHCGACDNACPAGESCVDGQCKDTCDGMCDPILQLCDEGRCVCRLGLSLCNGACVDRQVSNIDCGDCTVRCDGGLCADGLCVPLCPADLTECPDGTCTDLESDHLHCGSCGNTCGSDELCVAGDCRPYTPASCTSCPCPVCGDLQCCTTAAGPACVDASGCPE
jgi:hypothetical protein